MFLINDQNKYKERRLETPNKLFVYGYFVNLFVINNFPFFK